MHPYTAGEQGLDAAGHATPTLSAVPIRSLCRHGDNTLQAADLTAIMNMISTSGRGSTKALVDEPESTTGKMATEQSVAIFRFGAPAALRPIWQMPVLGLSRCPIRLLRLSPGQNKRAAGQFTLACRPRP